MNQVFEQNINQSKQIREGIHISRDQIELLESQIEEQLEQIALKEKQLREFELERSAKAEEIQQMQ